MSLRSPTSQFPDPHNADVTGLVAVTEKMSPAMLLDAYMHGLFPWTDTPVRWYSPHPRAVFLPQYVHLPRKLGKIARKSGFKVTFDAAFSTVMRACSQAHRHEGEWISSVFIESYGELHAMGFAHSVEVWQEEALVGGLYGVQIGALFAGESMFYEVSNASKVAFSALLANMKPLGIQLIDAQVINDHTHNLGAVLVSRNDYLAALPGLVSQKTVGHGVRWPLDPPISICAPSPQKHS